MAIGRTPMTLKFIHMHACTITHKISDIRYPEIEFRVGVGGWVILDFNLCFCMIFSQIF